VGRFCPRDAYCKRIEPCSILAEKAVKNKKVIVVYSTRNRVVCASYLRLVYLCLAIF